MSEKLVCVNITVRAVVGEGVAAAVCGIDVVAGDSIPSHAFCLMVEKKGSLVGCY